MHIDLLRAERTSDGVFGTLAVPGLPLLFTCEEEDQNNARNVSCIPVGTYPLRRTVYHKHGYETFEVCDVPGRSRILIHPGNTEEDTQGCILVGLSRGRITVEDEDSGKRESKRAVLSSKRAFAAFMARMSGINSGTISVIWA